uniref:Protein kinase domain-containing protein n=1 Tax=Trichuris muris TaxID=70415 RepID=A0A5S6QEZ7_TRIMR
MLKLASIQARQKLKRVCSRLLGPANKEKFRQAISSSVIFTGRHRQELTRILWLGCHCLELINPVFLTILRNASKTYCTSEMINDGQSLEANVPLKVMLLGTVVGERYEIIKHKKRAAYKLMFEVQETETSERYTMKIEMDYDGKNDLQKESFILRNLTESAHVCKFEKYGLDHSFKYLVTSLVGPSLAQIRKKTTNMRFNLGTVLRIGIQDVRPENFAIGLGDKKNTIYVLDFTTARQFNFGAGIIREPDYSGFCGSRQYASFNAHRGHELGEHDDIISLLYMLADLYLGELPWSGHEEIHRIGLLKTNAKPTEIFRDMPPIIMHIYEAMKTSVYGQMFNHRVIIENLEQAAANINAPEDLVFEEPNGETSGVLEEAEC